MGLFDEVVSVVGKLAGRQQNSLVEQAIAMINNPQIGGLSGLIEKFKTNGLGEVVSSWIGTGSNLPVTADQISSLLGADGLRDIASKAGVSPEQVSGHLADILPRLIDQLTPDGKLPEGNALRAGLASLAQKFLQG